MVKTMDCPDCAHGPGAFTELCKDHANDVDAQRYAARRHFRAKRLEAMAGLALAGILARPMAEWPEDPHGEDTTGAVLRTAIEWAENLIHALDERERAG